MRSNCHAGKITRNKCTTNYMPVLEQHKNNVSYQESLTNLRLCKQTENTGLNTMILKMKHKKNSFSQNLKLI